MRKLLYTLVASALIAVLVPATALAQGHHRRHHSRHHHNGIRHREFGHASAPTTTSMADNAGTVASFDGTTLVITLANGSTVSGTVNGDTEIECEAADMSGTSFNRDDEGGDHSGSNDQGDDNGDNNDNDNDDNNMQNCDTSSLTTGAMVHEAELKLSGAGAVWDKVELVTSSSSTSSSGDDD